MVMWVSSLGCYFIFALRLSCGHWWSSWDLLDEYRASAVMVFKKVHI